MRFVDKLPAVSSETHSHVNPRLRASQRSVSVLMKKNKNPVIFHQDRRRVKNVTSLWTAPPHAASPSTCNYSQKRRLLSWRGGSGNYTAPSLLLCPSEVSRRTWRSPLSRNNLFLLCWDTFIPELMSRKKVSYLYLSSLTWTVLLSLLILPHLLPVSRVTASCTVPLAH